MRYVTLQPLYVAFDRRCVLCARFQVALQVLYKQVGMLLPNVCALRTLRLGAKRTAKTAAETEEGPSRLIPWTRSRSLGSALRCIVFPSGSRWEPEQGEWIRIN